LVYEKVLINKFILKKFYYILFGSLIFAFANCGQKSLTTEDEANTDIISIQNEIKSFEYDSLTIPMFFKALVSNHFNDIYSRDSIEYIQFSKVHHLIASNQQNLLSYFTLKFLNQLFTSNSAQNCSKGEILNIPYMWHWVNSNPRHEICFTETNIALLKTKPPIEFSKYGSYADIDRTPFLFLSDMFQSKEKYYSSNCDTFSTFGWCSEREMAFVALCTLLDYKGKVIAKGNHSWSEFLIPMKSENGLRYFKVSIDHTFNSNSWTKINGKEIQNWQVYIGDSKLSKWYNQKAHSTIELQKINNYMASKVAMQSIESKVVRYLKN
jgi:hypothetical protein